MTRRSLLTALLAAALVPALVACGGGSDKKESKDAATSAPATAAAAATTAATSAPAAAATSAAAPAGPQTMELKAGDFFYDPGTVSVKTGAIQITMNNGGERPHTLNVRKQGGGPELAKLPQVQPGKSGTLDFTITEPGTYELFCTLPGHADRGQKATLTVS
jgi:uncharacterized cupredoxin-like copper-binding protein